VGQNELINGFSYLIRPSAEKRCRFRLFRLGETPTRTIPVEPPAFCLIPYQNPSIKKPEPLFFKILGEQEYHFEENPSGQQEKIILKPSLGKKEYLKKIEMLKKNIALGNIYEINYCIEFSAENTELDCPMVFSRLNSLAEAPYASLVKINNDYIISATPELFLKREGEKLYTKPIKGTARRGKTAQEDEVIKNELYLNVKERTENVMAVDVARNDLSVVAERASVKVNKLYNIETYNTVHQMVSTVSCSLKPGVGFGAIIEATFPMASMTGAPKISAMNLIEAHESFERKFYSGAMGMIDKKGDFELAVIIRSIFYNSDAKRLSIAVGSAITHLSDPEKEYEECLLKAGALLEALNAEIAS
jgi:para-aminobenzoate synthetase component I